MCYMSSASSQVGVRELRQNLSVYLARVRRGESLTVTEHRRVVAVLGPAGRGQDALAHLVAEGRAVPARRTPVQLPKPLKLKVKTPLSELVRELGDDVV
jgi:prevent-host-death family protein